MKTNLPLENYTEYQPNMLLDFTISFEKNVLVMGKSESVLINGKTYNFDSNGVC